MTSFLDPYFAIFDGEGSGGRPAAMVIQGSRNVFYDIDVKNYIKETK